MTDDAMLIDPDPKEPIQAFRGEGATTAALKFHSGKVVLAFPAPVQWVALDPRVAAAMADQMLTMAIEAGVPIQITMPKREISDVHRQAVINRVETVIRQLQERHRRPAHVAAEVVDVVIKGLLT
jgi:hypothetical protein